MIIEIAEADGTVTVVQSSAVTTAVEVGVPGPMGPGVLYIGDGSAVPPGTAAGTLIVRPA